MITENDKIKARKKLYRIAISYRRKGRTSGMFKRFVDNNWPTVYNRVSRKELQHLVDLVWSEWYSRDKIDWRFA